MASIISITDYVHIFYKKIFQTSADDIAGEPYLIIGFIYCVDGETVEHIIIESRHRFNECDPSSLRAFIQENEPISLNTLADPEDGEIIRKKISDFIASLVSDCVRTEGLKKLRVNIIVEFNQEEEDNASMELDNAEFLGEFTGMVEKENEVCAICLDEMKVDEIVVCTPCVHKFHDACIGKWFERKSFCPLCRFKIDKFL